MPAGRPAKPNKIRVSIKIDRGVALASLEIARELKTDRSSLIEGLIVRFGPQLMAEEWKKKDRAKRDK